MRPTVGQLINNKYRLLRFLGAGSMGYVFEARHELLGASFAIKFLRSELSPDRVLVRRFLQEAQASGRISSHHVVRVSDVDQASDGHAYIVLEYLQGKTLETLHEDLYRTGQRLAHADALEYTMQMLAGVDAAHKAGVIHRDLKPDNVMITPGDNGRPLLKLLDFGIAKLRIADQVDRGLTVPGLVMGTPHYMAPEQTYYPEAVDARADIFSLGVMIFEMLAGRRPVGGDQPHEIAIAYLSGQIARLSDLVPGISPELATAVHLALAPLAQDRYADTGEFLRAIERFTQPARSAPVAVKAAVSRSPKTLPLVLYSYADEDEGLLQELRSHLRPLVREGRIETWYAGKIDPGEERQNVARLQLEEAKMILLLISASYFKSDRCYLEMQLAVERCRAGAQVVPVIVRQCDWRHTPLLQGLQALPRDSDHEPINSRANRDEAWTHVARELRGLLAG